MGSVGFLPFSPSVSDSSLSPGGSESVYCSSFAAGVEWPRVSLVGIFELWSPRRVVAGVVGTVL